MTSRLHPDRTAIERDQFLKLRVLLAELLPRNPFYSNKLNVAGIGPEISTLNEFLERMPLTSKKELVQNQSRTPPYGSNLTYPLKQYTRFSQTSATSGSPMAWLDTPESWQWMLNNWERIYQSAGIGSKDRLFFAFSFAPFLGFWTAFEAALRMGCFCVPGGGLSSASRLKLIRENQVTVLLCTPTYALRLAEVAAEEKIDLSSTAVKKIIVAGEPGGSVPSLRARIEKLWPGAVVVDHHGMTETGPVSYGCPNQPNVLHIMESAYIAEVLDPGDSRKVPSGRKGELVLTNLGRTGSPLLRYRTGDLVEAAAEQPCACGTYELALLGGILGRTDDMIIVRGVNIYPCAIDEILSQFEGVGEYRVEVSTTSALPELKIQIEPRSPAENLDALTKRIEALLYKIFALRIPVRATPYGSLPRFEMKAVRWVRT
jgi:phenylacetate-CoA ligase